MASCGGVTEDDGTCADDVLYRILERIMSESHGESTESCISESSECLVFES